MLKKAEEILEANGFVLDPELCDHHVTYLYTFPKTRRTYILELHFRIVGVYQYDKANQMIDSVFSADRITPEYQTVGDTTYRVLPPTEYTFYMLHHMLKHYLSVDLEFSFCVILHYFLFPEKMILILINYIIGAKNQKSRIFMKLL